MYEIRIVVLTSEDKIQRIVDYLVDLMELLFALGAGKLLTVAYRKEAEIDEQTE